jgi:CDP-diacylglycerol--glycerol-3-phosphate 3-phosphatidyltransferase
VRVVILSIGLVFAAGELIDDVNLLEASVYVMAGLTAFTVGQRVWHVRRELRQLDGTAEPSPDAPPGM